MYLTYRFRIYPNESQSALLDNKFLLAQTAYNQLVAWHYASLQKDKSYDSQIQALPPVGCSCDHLADQLLTETNRYNLTDRSIVISAIRYFVRNRKKAVETQIRLHYKSVNKSKQICSFNAKGQLNQIGDNCLHIVLLGDLKTSMTRKVLGRIINITISKTITGRYYICLLAKKVDSKKTLLKTMQKKSLKIVGVDMGISHFIILSDGTKYENPRFMGNRLKKLQQSHRHFSRKEKNSKNRDKARISLACQYEHVYNQRNGFLQRLSTELIKEYDIIAVESLDIKHMMHQSPLARKIADAAWRQFILMLQYKAEWYGKILIQIPRYLPSTKKCCRCQTINNNLTLNDRTWVCTKCNTSHDRDINAAINILVAGTRQIIKKWPTLDQAALKPSLSDKR
ncbi:MAG: transposase [Bacillota bacterium]|nr:transposase [Bacillota bacterium]